MVRLCLILKRIFILSSRMGVPFCIPTRNEWEFCCSTVLLTFGIFSVLDLGCFSRCVAVSYCFNLQFPDDIGCWTSFHRLICVLGILKIKIALHTPLDHVVCITRLVLLFSYSLFLQFSVKEGAWLWRLLA